MNFPASAFSGTRARWSRLSVTPILLIALLGLALLGSGCNSKDGSVTFPQPPAPEQMNWLFDVYGTTADDVYACGNKGAMFHYDGTNWSYVDLGTGKPITTLWGPGDGTLFAAGYGGNLWKMVGGSWSAQTSGTSKNIYRVGNYNNEIYLCGASGTLRHLEGNSWTGAQDVVVIRNPENLAPQDTLSLSLDVPSLLTLSQYFIGGAYNLPDFDGERIGLLGTDGMVLAQDLEPELYDWRLRPVGNDQFSIAEWVLSATSSVVNLGDNYIGTSEGWIFKLSETDGKLDWVMQNPDVTLDAQNGLRDMWLDENSNLYCVTDGGEMLFQSADYNFVQQTGVRKLFPVTHAGLTSIWGSDSDHLFMTGFTENMIVQASMDFSDTTLVFEEVPLEFPNKGGQSIGLFEDQFGLPRR